MDKPSKGRRWRSAIYLTIDYGRVIGHDDFLEVNKAGNKRDGYVYSISTFAEGTFRQKELTEQERRNLITALGGKP